MKVEKGCAMEEMKVCSKCNINKSLSLFRPIDRCGKKCYRSHCRQCESEKRKEYRGKNKDKVKSYHSQYYIKNKPMLLERAKIWGLENPDRRKVLWDKSTQKKILTLSDSYIVQLIKNTSNIDIETIKSLPQLINIKKQQIKINRLLNNK